MLKNQVKIYSLDTKAFYTEEEQELNKKMVEAKIDMKVADEYLKYCYLSNEKEVIKKDIEDYIYNCKRMKHLKYLHGAYSLDEIYEMNKLFYEFADEQRKMRKLINKDKPRKNRNKEKEDAEGKEYYKLKSSEYSKFRNSNEICKDLSKEYTVYKKKLGNMIYKNLKGDITRKLNEAELKENKQISIFESALTRTLGIETNELSLDIMVVSIFHYDIMNSLIKNGFTYNNEKYIFFTASAGQIREKKIVMMKESVYNKFEKTFLCGLTREDINNMGMINTNKFLSYVALNSSGTEEMIIAVKEILEDEIEDIEEDEERLKDKDLQEIKGFDIDKCIVIADFEGGVTGVVDYIDKKEVERNKYEDYRDENGKKKKKKVTKKVLELQDNIERKEMTINIEHSDGCGWTLKGKTNHMIRLPWIKGLMAKNNKVFEWCDEYNDGSYKIIDIYGKEWDLKADKIEYVFSKSQFKLWKFYKNEYDKNGNLIKYGWDKYKEAFKTYNCKANMCNVEPTRKKDFKQAKLNYQMWQTLTDITNEEIKQFTNPAKEYLKSIYIDKDTMIHELKADKENKKKNYFQQALNIYPELLKDAHCKSELQNKISSKMKKYKSGKFEMKSAYNTFIVPDLFSWMQYTFYSKEKFDRLSKKGKIGLLRDGEVSCSLFKSDELIVNRSPHLYREWGIRKNINNEDTKKWLDTNAIYVSCHDLLSLLLMYDEDGDLALCIDEPKLIQIAKRNMGQDLPYKDSEGNWNMEKIVPLYYEMSIAKGQELNADNFYKSLKSAFTSSNIGKFSNQLTKLWAKTKKGDDLTVHKIITAQNNFQIDSAKTLISAEAVDKVDKEIKQLEKEKLPYFFLFAKDKEERQTNECGSSVVDRIAKEIETLNKQNFDFSKVGRFSYKILMNNPKIEINKNIIKAYEVLDGKKNMLFKSTKHEKQDVSNSIYTSIKNEFIQVITDNYIKYEDAVDMIIKHIYIDKKLRNRRKTLLFTVFGEEIVKNLRKNINKDLDDGYITCSECGKRVKSNSNNQKYCNSCKKKMKETKKKYCSYCKKEIIDPSSNKQKYCSDECKKEAKRIKDRERVAKKRAANL
ncbi:hypothetical protein [Inediibacterium massiliense]|uniref:hypothetical protein n=1 Tax=Inediibacterium massiliense TaxID=1658111 RepID=UPI0006B5C179|nr:hypothetical protein [Inediibacterium massiliense]